MATILKGQNLVKSTNHLDNYEFRAFQTKSKHENPKSNDWNPRKCTSYALDPSYYDEDRIRHQFSLFLDKILTNLDSSYDFYNSKCIATTKQTPSSFEDVTYETKWSMPFDRLRSEKQETDETKRAATFERLINQEAIKQTKRMVKENGGGSVEDIDKDEVLNRLERTAENLFDDAPTTKVFLFLSSPTKTHARKRNASYVQGKLEEIYESMEKKNLVERSLTFQRLNLKRINVGYVDDDKVDKFTEEMKDDEIHEKTSEENVSSKSHPESKLIKDHLMTTGKSSKLEIEISEKQELTSLREKELKMSDNKAVKEKKSISEIVVRTDGVVKSAVNLSLIMESRVQDKSGAIANELKYEELFSAAPIIGRNQDPKAFPIVESTPKNFNGKEKRLEEEIGSNNFADQDITDTEQETKPEQSLTLLSHLDCIQENIIVEMHTLDKKGIKTVDEQDQSALNFVSERNEEKPAADQTNFPTCTINDELTVVEADFIPTTITSNERNQASIKANSKLAIFQRLRKCFFSKRNITQHNNPSSQMSDNYLIKSKLLYSFSFEPDVVCSVSVIPLQHKSCSVCMSFVRLGHHNG